MGRSLGRWVTRTRAERCFVLMVMIWVLSGADLFFTVWAHQFTPFVEGNPVAAMLFQGMPGGGEAGVDRPLADYAAVGGLKLVTLVAGTWILWPLRRTVQAEVGLWVLLVAFGYLMGLWSSYTRVFLNDRSLTQMTDVRAAAVVTSGDSGVVSIYLPPPGMGLGVGARVASVDASER